MQYILFIYIYIYYIYVDHDSTRSHILQMFTAFLLAQVCRVFIIHTSVLYIDTFCKLLDINYSTRNSEWSQNIQ